MKVLFAVSNEEISESIVKKYQREYKQIISYKNVYYFNAILKELQKDKSYDRVVISEDLEAFTHTQYDQIDKFIFEKLDGISDEATDLRGNDTPIILICSDRRTKSEQMLVKLFGIGIYNAFIGTDRSVDEVCRLINRPRSKKEAKNYYKIEAEDVNYQSENENDVSEIEIQNILAHYKRLGKNEDRYLDSFDNIAAQYNDTQLRIISKFLPLNVRAVLEERSPKYQQIMSFNNSVSDSLRKSKKQEKENGPSETLLTSKVKDKILSKPVVIPSSVNMNTGKKLSRVKPQDALNIYEKPTRLEQEEAIKQKNETKTEFKAEKAIYDELAEIESIKEEVKPVKRGRGRPRKYPVPTEEELANKPKRGRGRPRKNPLPENQEDDILSGILPIKNDYEETINNEKDNVILPGLSSNNNYVQQDKNNNEDILPGLNLIDEDYEDEDVLPGLRTSTHNQNYEEDSEEILPGISSTNRRYDDNEDDVLSNLSVQPQQYSNMLHTTNEYDQIDNKSSYQSNTSTFFKQPVQDAESIDLSYLLTAGKKIVTFVGTSKNGTSFIVNNLATLISSIGINTAILDTTKNRNAYYIYTKNEEELRNIAAQSIDGLANGVARGITVNKNLTVYTSLPNEGEGINNVDKILETLLKQHSLILIDTDFETPINYFKQSQETYLVQTLDILTIQPLTAFLRELKAKNILDEKKLRVILNKAVKIRGINEKTIIGGMAYYNDPAMSFMTELFDRNMMKYISIPFEEETYIKYLENIIECNISLKGYSKVFMQTLKELSNMVYPTTNTYRPSTTQNYGGDNTFSPSINSTLDQMKNNY